MPAKAATALVAGAVGRLGEALVNTLVARGAYGEVAILAEQRITPAMDKVSVFTADSIPPARDLFLVLGTDSLSTRRFANGRDAPFTEMNEHNSLAFATAAMAAGIERIVLLSSSPAWQQFGAAHQGLGSSLELGLGALPVKHFVVLRPVRESTSKGLGFVQRFVQAYLNIQMLMMPRSVPVLTSSQIASAALLSIGHSGGAGVNVHSAASIAGLLEPKASG